MCVCEYAPAFVMRCPSLQSLRAKVTASERQQAEAERQLAQAQLEIKRLNAHIAVLRSAKVTFASFLPFLCGPHAMCG